MTTRVLIGVLMMAAAAFGEDLSPVALGRIDAHAHFLAEAKPESSKVAIHGSRPPLAFARRRAISC